MLQAGYAQAIITPSLARPVYLAGYAPNKRAVAIHDDLWARALALRFGQTDVLLLTADLIGLGRQICLEVMEAIQQQTGRAAQMLIACSHVHFGPDTIGLWGPTPAESGVDPVYMAELKETLVRIGVQALADAGQSVTMSGNAIGVYGVAKNYREPHITDEEATCLQWHRADGGIFATLVIYPCHPEGVHPDSLEITSDYVYQLRATIEAQTSAPAMFMPGALGGMMSPALPSQTHEAVAEMGATIAHAALSALAEKPAQPVDSLRYDRVEVAIPMQNVLFQMASDVGLLPNLLNAAGEIVTEVGLIRIGDAWLATIPGELFPELGLFIKQRLKAYGATLAGVICLANDELGYILPKEKFIFPQDWLNPGKQYEESMSIGPETAPRLLDALWTLI